VEAADGEFHAEIDHVVTAELDPSSLRSGDAPKRWAGY
jgi:hypothetical protein